MKYSAGEFNKFHNCLSVSYSIRQCSGDSNIEKNNRMNENVKVTSQVWILT